MYRSTDWSNSGKEGVAIARYQRGRDIFNAVADDMQRCFPDRQYNKDLNEELPAMLNKNYVIVDLVDSDEESDEKVVLKKDDYDKCVDGNIDELDDGKGKEESEEEEEEDEDEDEDEMTRGGRVSDYEESGEDMEEEKWNSEEENGCKNMDVEKDEEREVEMNGEQESQIQQNDTQQESVNGVLLDCD